MYGDPQLLIFTTLFTVALYWALPAIPTVRATLLIVVSALLIFSVSPLALFAAGLVTLTGYAGLRVSIARKSKNLAWLGVAVIAGEFFIFQRINSMQTDGAELFLVVLGLSYICFRTVAIVLSGHQYRRSPQGPPSLMDMVLLNTFYPIVPAGPIERPENLRLSVLVRPFEPDLFIYGIMRVAVGFFVAKYIGDDLLLTHMAEMQAVYFGSEEGGTVLGAYWFCVVSLLYLYANFSGFMSIAVGVGALFGFRISENFRWPFMATDIQEFWKRWHITLGDFANRYMYFPMLKVFGGNPYISIFITFLIIGLWHEISLPFLAWGVAHGAALVLHAWLARRDLLKAAPSIVRQGSKALNWVITMFFVCWAWTIASAPTLTDGIRLSGMLVGVGL